MKGFRSKMEPDGTSLSVQWLRHHATNARGTGSIPGWGLKTPHAAQCSQKIEMENFMHAPSEEWNLRNERKISHKCQIIRRLSLISWPMTIYQVSLPILKSMNLLLGLWLDSPCLYSLPINTTCPKPSTKLPVTWYCMHSPNCNSSAILK